MCILCESVVCLFWYKPNYTSLMPKVDILSGIQMHKVIMLIFYMYVVPLLHELVPYQSHTCTKTDMISHLVALQILKFL